MDYMTQNALMNGTMAGFSGGGVHPPWEKFAPPWESCTPPVIICTPLENCKK